MRLTASPFVGDRDVVTEMVTDEKLESITMLPKRIGFCLGLAQASVVSALVTGAGVGECLSGCQDLTGLRG